MDIGERLNMGMKERDRLHAIRNILEGRTTQVQAAKILSCSERHVRRMCVQVRKSGERALVHGLRGRPSNNRLDEEFLGQALSALHQPLWEGFGPVFAWEKLAEFYGINLGKTTVRNLMIMTGLWEVHRRGNRHRAWRERRACVGMMTQLDGSDHKWFEERGPRCALLIYIDDATSRILYGEFVKVEDTLTLMRSTKTYFKKKGRPLAFYVDKDSIYKINRQASIEEDLRDGQPLTQFTRAMKELNVEVIAADSPQAKGRVERGFDTHQDRLVKELRLRGISTMEEGNRYLWDIYIPQHNARYAVEPASLNDVHRPLLPSHNLDEVFSLRTERAVFLDFTVRFKNRFFQLQPKQPVRVRPKDKILVEVRLDGSTHLRFKDRYLNFKTLPQRPERPLALREMAEPRVAVAIGRQHRPASDHPWRRYRFKKSELPVHAPIPSN